MDLNRSEASRRRGLAYTLSLIAGYEESEIRAREHNPPHLRTLEEICRECNHYRREAHRVWDFPCPETVEDSTGAQGRSIQV